MSKIRKTPINRQEEKEFLTAFERASKSGEEVSITREQAEGDRLRRGLEFKRKMLGLLGRDATKTLAEVVSALQESGLADSEEEAKKLIPSQRIDYSYAHYVSIEEVTNKFGEIAYRVSRHAEELDFGYYGAFR